MITASYSLTATERVLPKLALDFTTAALDPRVTFTRTGNTATVTNSSGVIVGINADLPRFDFDPVTFVCRGLLIEESRTNALLNSLLDGTSLATQTVVVTAAARTLSFYGTGQIVLSGAASATVTGTGAYPTRTTLTFTPSAGALILTVTGTVQFAQLEAGAFGTSYIPTNASQVTRSADVATMTGTNFSNWYNQASGSMIVQASNYAAIPASKFPFLFTLGRSSTNDRHQLLSDSTLTITYQERAGGVTYANLSSGTFTVGTPFKAGISYATDNFNLSFNAGAPVNDNAGVVPTNLNIFQIGMDFGNAQQWNGHFQKFWYYPQQIINAELQAFTK
jgi:hypothetical protein